MCIFATHVSKVTNTRIAVLPLDGKRQLLVYSNAVVLATQGVANAMILPVPNHNGAIELIDMSQYPGDFWKHCESFFPTYTRESLNFGGGGGFGMEQSSAPLPTIQVGGYTCSIAPTIQDLSRIQTNVFKIDNNVAETLSKHYGKGFGFIIAKFDKTMQAHPLAITSDRCDNNAMFIPTRHEHGHASPPQRYTIVRDSRRAQGFTGGDGRVNAPVNHPDITCDECNRQVRGNRWKCTSCIDFDLCTLCYAQTSHKATHLFLDIPIPLSKFGNRNLNSNIILNEGVVYPEGIPKVHASNEKGDFDHTLYIFNGILSAFPNQFNALKNGNVSEGHVQFGRIVSGTPRLHGVQKVTIKGDRDNCDYYAHVIISRGSIQEK